MQIYASMDLRQLFSGKFSFNRHISEPQINLNGTADFEASDGKTIICRENGQYNLAGKRQIFYQNRIFVVGEESLHIYKEDKSLLHVFVINSPLTFPIELTHVHHCADDQYFLSMSIESFDNFSTSYHIKGPSKGYIIRTNYERT